MLIPNARIRRQGQDGRADAVILDGSQIPLPVTFIPDGLAYFNEVTSVAGGSTVTLLTYVVPVGKNLSLRGAQLSGDNIARYTINIDAQPIAKMRSYFTAYNNDLNLYGLTVDSGSTISIEVNNYRNSISAFNATIFGELINA
jgi:hypothetical protein